MNNSKTDLIRAKLISDQRGNLSFVEVGKDVPFQVMRAFYMNAVPEGEMRGGHAHYECEQFAVCLHGSFAIKLESVHGTEHIDLSGIDQALYIPPMTWVEMLARDDSSACLVLASHHYEESDYIRDYTIFKNLI